MIDYNLLDVENLSCLAEVYPELVEGNHKKQDENPKQFFYKTSRSNISSHFIFSHNLFSRIS